MRLTWIVLGAPAARRLSSLGSGTPSKMRRARATRDGRTERRRAILYQPYSAGGAALSTVD
jgi:hypothetical protein